MILRCPVRDCGRPLDRTGRSVTCPVGHLFDVAKSGYINLLQPQERRSSNPGDSAEAVAARRRLHDLGLGAPFAQAVARLIDIRRGEAILDAGCGDGYYLGTLAAQTGADAHGVDISIPAIDLAARRYPECEWIVANADRLLPYADGAFRFIVSITARMNSSEFRRVLQSDGWLLVAIPAPDDLIELRGAGKERVERTVQTFAEDFRVLTQERVTTKADLDADAVRDLLVSIYRPLQSGPPRAMEVTFSLDFLLFEPVQ